MEFDRKREMPLAFGIVPTGEELLDESHAAHGGAPSTYVPTGPGDPTALLPWMDDFIVQGGGGATEVPAKARPHEAGPAKRVAEVELGRPGGPRFDPRFVSMAQGSIHEANAPRAVRLPDAIVKGLDEAYTRSNTTDHKERGGNIVKTYWGGNYEVRHGGEDSENDSWQANRTDKRAGQELIGTYHTHDYSHDKRPYDSGTFSDADVANLASLEDRLKLVRSGKNTYMLSRTKEFDEMAKKVADDPEKLSAFQKQMSDTYNAAYNRVYKNDPANHQAALEAGVEAAARRYHLLYYRGQGAKLDRVAPAAPSK